MRPTGPAQSARGQAARLQAGQHTGGRGIRYRRLCAGFNASIEIQ